jgi:hypothetical protein
MGTSRRLIRWRLLRGRPAGRLLSLEVHIVVQRTLYTLPALPLPKCAASCGRRRLGGPCSRRRAGAGWSALWQVAVVGRWSHCKLRGDHRALLDTTLGRDPALTGSAQVKPCILHNSMNAGKQA